MRSPRLSELPAPPPDRTGWPWTEESTPLPATMRDGSPWPLISVVTPAYNQAGFIEETIRSILLQGYPDFEHIIINDGSTDQTLQAIEPYGKWVTCITQANAGQTPALNRGFKMAKGALIGWQNSDDYYDRDAFGPAAMAALAFPGDHVFFGENDYVDAASKFICKKNVCFPTYEAMIPWPCISNQSMFFRRSLFDEGVFLDEKFRHYMDYEYFWRLLLRGYRFRHVPVINGMLRTHPAARGASQGAVAQGEGFQIYNSLLASGALPRPVRERLLEAMRRECLNDFGHHRAETFRRHFMEVLRAGGLRAITPPLVVRYIIALLGPRCVRLVANR